MSTRAAIVKWRQTEPELILCAIRWYLRYSLSLRDVEELFGERGLGADHTTVCPGRIVTSPRTLRRRPALRRENHPQRPRGDGYRDQTRHQHAARIPGCR